MKKLFPGLALAVVSHTALCTTLFHNQDSTKRTIVQDTTREETISYGPFGSRKVRSLGYYATTTDNKHVFQLSSGVSIFNVLRGQVPNAEISPSAISTSILLRGNSPLLVIDGLPVNTAISGNYNFNSFEYQSISAISSGNAVAGIYGGSGMGGALLLQSKTGENYDQATIEVNSYSTLASQENFLSTSGKDARQWILSNSVAYMQDFGKVDTRVSCNYSSMPSPSAGGDSHLRNYAFRINSGVAITERFKARVILDSYYLKATSLYSYPYFDGSQTDDGKGHRKLLQGNLALTYQVLDWLKVSAQGSLSKIENDNTQFTVRTIPDNPATRILSNLDWDQKRSFMNFFISADKKLSTDLSLTAFTGFQYEKYKPVKTSSSRQDSGGLEPGSATASEQRLEFKTKSWLNGLGLNYREFAFVDLTYRRDQFQDDHKDTYSVSGSFVYSEAFHLTSAGFSSGKIRGSFGKMDVVNRLNYPYGWTTDPYGNWMSLLPISGKNFETGTDLGFVNNRIMLSLSYFKNTNDNAYMYIPGWGTVPGVLLDFGALKTSGWEVALGTTPLKNENVQLSTKLTWGKYKTKLDEDKDLGVDLPSNPSGLINPTPDWRAGLLNQLTWKNLFFSFLVDVRKQGTFTQSANWVLQDGTQAKLRDVSIGIDLTPALLGRIGIKEAKLSVSGRNLWTIYSKSSDDVEEVEAVSLYRKTGSVSLSLRF